METEELQRKVRGLQEGDTDNLIVSVQAAHERAIALGRPGESAVLALHMALRKLKGAKAMLQTAADCLAAHCDGADEGVVDAQGEP